MELTKTICGVRPKKGNSATTSALSVWREWQILAAPGWISCDRCTRPSSQQCWQAALCASLGGPPRWRPWPAQSPVACRSQYYSGKGLRDGMVHGVCWGVYTGVGAGLPTIGWLPRTQRQLQADGLQHGHSMAGWDMLCVTRRRDEGTYAKQPCVTPQSWLGCEWVSPASNGCWRTSFHGVQEQEYVYPILCAESRGECPEECGGACRMGGLWPTELSRECWGVLPCQCSYWLSYIRVHDVCRGACPIGCYATVVMDTMSSMHDVRGQQSVSVVLHAESWGECPEQCGGAHYVAGLRPTELHDVCWGVIPDAWLVWRLYAKLHVECRGECPIEYCETNRLNATAPRDDPPMGWGGVRHTPANQ